MITALITLPFLLQGLAIIVDEFYFHHKRGLPKWERIGHPIDTFFYLLTLIFIFLVPYSISNAKIYLGLAIVSTLIIIKDELIHFEHGIPHEQFLHSLLFILHPLSLICAFFIWPIMHNTQNSWIDFLQITIDQQLILKLALAFQGIIAGTFFIYQIVYWNIFKRSEHAKS